MNPKHLKGILLLTTLMCLPSLNALAQVDYGKPHQLKGQDLEYLVSVPKTYAQDGSGSPLILFLHGGDGSNTKHHPKKYATSAGIDFDFIVVAPSCSAGCNWSSLDFNALLTQVTEDYNVDTNRIYITGYSYGGYGTWGAISKYSSWFAAAIPIAGGGSTSSVCNAKNVAIWAFHGDKDNVTPYSGSKKLIATLKGCGAKAQLETLQGHGHGIWPTIYKDQRIYDWLLKQNKTQ